MSVYIYQVEKSMECYVLSEENGSKMRVHFTRLWETEGIHHTGHISQHFSSRSSMLYCHLTILFLVLQIIGSHLAYSCTRRFGQPFPHPPFPSPHHSTICLNFPVPNILIIYYSICAKEEDKMASLHFWHVSYVVCSLFDF